MTALLAALAAPVVAVQVLDCPSGCASKVDSTRQLLADVQRRVDVYQMKHWEYPSSLQDAYGMDPVPVDMWGRPIRLIDGVDGKFVASFGADGLPGGHGDAADLIAGVGY